MASSLFPASGFPVPAGTNPEWPKKDRGQYGEGGPASDVRASDVCL